MRSFPARLPEARIAHSGAQGMARREAVGKLGKVGLIDSPSRAWSMFSMAELSGAKSEALASTGGVAAEAGGLCGSNGSVADIDLAPIVAVAVAVAKNDVPVESTGLLPADGFDPEVAPGMAARHQTELQSSLLEAEIPVGDLHNTRQILPNDNRQSVDCRTPS
jgi:hypothetical protein